MDNQERTRVKRTSLKGLERNNLKKQSLGLSAKHKNGSDSEAEIESIFEENQESIQEKFQAPMFFFQNFQGRRLAFGMLNGDQVLGDVGRQQWQFLRLENVVVTNRSGKKNLKWRLININRIDFVDSADEEDGKNA